MPAIGALDRESTRARMRPPRRGPPGGMVLAPHVQAGLDSDPSGERADTGTAKPIMLLERTTRAMRAKDRNQAILVAMLCATVCLSSGCSDAPVDPTRDGSAPDVVQPKPDTSPPDGGHDATPHPDVFDLPDTTPRPDVFDLPDTTPVDTRDETKKPDVAGDPDAVCPGDTVWDPSSGTFTITSQGGLPPPGDAGCRGPMSHIFSPGTKTLAQAGCVGGQTVYHAVDLSVAETARLTTAISALRTTCRLSCGADAGETTVTVTDGSGCVRGVYESNFYAGCGQSRSLPPYIEFEDLYRVETLLREVVAAACAGGPVPEAGAGAVCRVTPPPQDAAMEAGTGVADVIDLPEGGPGPADVIDLPDGGPDDTGPVCRERVWTGASASFTLTRSGGLPPGGPLDAGCGTQPVTYVLSTAPPRLVQSGCIDGRRGRRQLELTNDQVNQIVAAAAALRTTCTKSCGADAPDVSLVVVDQAGSTEGVFNSNFYAGCPGRTVAPPYVAFDDLLPLMSLLQSTMTSSCSDGADAASPGICRSYCRQGLE